MRSRHETLVLFATPTPLELWHLLSLDAPTVAALWLWFAAHATHTRLAPLLVPEMFLAVWILYAADRLLDEHSLEARHHFHQRHRSAFLAGMTLAAAVLSLLLAHTHLAHAWFALAAVFAAWFTLVHLPRVPASARLPKELATGFIFAAAVWLPELPRHWPSALLFAGLCTLNCACIHAWETPQETHAFTRALIRWLVPLLVLLALATLIRSPAAIAVGLAAAALLVLHGVRRHVPATTARALADLALLTPVFLLR